MKAIFHMTEIGRAIYFYTKDEVLVEYLMVQDAENLQQFSSLIKFGFF